MRLSTMGFLVLAMIASAIVVQISTGRRWTIAGSGTQRRERRDWSGRSQPIFGQAESKEGNGNQEDTRAKQLAREDVCVGRGNKEGEGKCGSTGQT